MPKAYLCQTQPQSFSVCVCVCVRVYHWAQALINNQKSQHLKNVTFDIFRLHQMPSKSERKGEKDEKEGSERMSEKRGML